MHTHACIHTHTCILRQKPDTTRRKCVIWDEAEEDDTEITRTENSMNSRDVRMDRPQTERTKIME